MATAPNQPNIGTPTSLDPTQKKAMELMVKQAMSFLLRDDNAQYIVTRAKAEEPQTAVVEAITPLLGDIYNMASLAGVKVEQVTLLAAGIQIIAVLAKMLEAAGVITEEEIPQFCADVARRAVDKQNAKVWNSVMKGKKPQPGMAGAPVPQQPAKGV